MLFANMVNLTRDKNKFCRWGDSYAHHSGDLSAAVVGHSGEKINEKYRRRAGALFVGYPTDVPGLKANVRFWCMHASC